jgi:hypothetical protein
MGDFMSGRISGHEGRGPGKTATPRGHIIVSRKRIVTEKKSYRKGVLVGRIDV